jgi:hypothetical protein
MQSSPSPGRAFTRSAGQQRAEHGATSAPTGHAAQKLHPACPVRMATVGADRIEAHMPERTWPVSPSSRFSPTPQMASIATPAITKTK